MNKRIKKLAGKALDKAVPYTWTNLDPVEVERVMQEFGALIVKECMEVASPSYMNTPEDSIYYVELAIDRIADHFGVDE